MWIHTNGISTWSLSSFRTIYPFIEATTPLYSSWCSHGAQRSSSRIKNPGSGIFLSFKYGRTTPRVSNPFGNNQLHTSGGPKHGTGGNLTLGTRGVLPSSYGRRFSWSLSMSLKIAKISCLKSKAPSTCSKLTFIRSPSSGDDVVEKFGSLLVLMGAFIPSFRTKSHRGNPEIVPGQDKGWKLISLQVVAWTMKDGISQ